MRDSYPRVGYSHDPAIGLDARFHGDHSAAIHRLNSVPENIDKHPAQFVLVRYEVNWSIGIFCAKFNSTDIPEEEDAFPDQFLNIDSLKLPFRHFREP